VVFVVGHHRCPFFFCFFRLPSVWNISRPRNPPYGQCHVIFVTVVCQIDSPPRLPSLERTSYHLLLPRISFYRFLPPIFSLSSSLLPATQFFLVSRRCFMSEQEN
jgi:hypothetical protein